MYNYMLLALGQDLRADKAAFVSMADILVDMGMVGDMVHTEDTHGYGQVILRPLQSCSVLLAGHGMIEGPVLPLDQLL